MKVLPKILLPVAMLMLFCFAASAPAQMLSPAQAKPVSIIAEGSANDYWLAETFGDSDGAPVTSIRQRIDATTGKWTQIAVLQDRVLSAAAVGSRLAVVTPGGWQLVWDGGSYFGPDLPSGRVISRVAGEGEALWALAGPSAGQTPEIFRWTEGNGWTLRTTLPPDAASGAGSIAVHNGTLYAAYLASKSLYVDRIEKETWHRVAELPMSTHFKLIGNGPLPLLGWCDAGGKWTIYDLSQTPPKPLQSTIAAWPSDATVAGTSLRVVSLEKDGATQTGFENYGRGGAFGPDVIAQVVMSPPASEIPNLLLTGALTAGVIVMLRSRTSADEEALSAANIRVAPIGRRLAAGIIDAIPLLAGAYIVGRQIEAGPIPVADMGPRLLLPVFAGLLLYVGHVTACEIAFGRSIGKAIFRLRVVSLDGTPAPAGRIVLRNLMRVLDVALGLPIVLVLFTPTGQRFGDVAARTVVIADSPKNG